MDMDALQTFLSTTVVELAIKVLAAIAFWIIGRWLIGRVIHIMQSAMGRCGDRCGLERPAGQFCGWRDDAGAAAHQGG